MNYLEAINFGNKILKLSNIETYKLDNELLLAKVINCTREELLINLQKKIDKIKFNKYLKLVIRRKKNEPIAYIFKTKEFWKNKFYVNKNVLIPRPETEIIVDEVLKITNRYASKNFLDVGTGSGCIILSIIKERPNCYGTAIDISKKALKIANINAKMHHLENKISFINIDIDKFNLNKYDYIVSNPPYINKFELNRLGKNIRLFEPNKALEAGIDGLREIKKLILKSRKLLKINGKLIFEIGIKQLKFIMIFLNKNGFYTNKICKDIYSNPRVIIATKIF